MNPRIGLIIPSSNCLAEPQCNRYAAPIGIGIHVTRLRMTGPWHKPLKELQPAIMEAAAVLSDTHPGIILFNCTASSMEEGLSGEAMIIDAIQKAGGCAALTTGRAINEALDFLSAKKLVLISPYPAKTNEHEIRYLEQAGFEVLHDFGLGLKGGEEYIAVTPERWKEIVYENLRPEADAYLLSCTNTRMIEGIEEIEKGLGRPVITSNQAALWAALQRLEFNGEIAALGRLFVQ
ncbi:MAG: maleate cis-trans isomerase family protein [Candidatus Binatia bacterium]